MRAIVPEERQEISEWTFSLNRRASRAGAAAALCGRRLSGLYEFPIPDRVFAALAAIEHHV